MIIETLLTKFLPRMVHIKCRSEFYPFSSVKRVLLLDNQVPWSTKLDSYHPEEYESEVLKNKTWADPHISCENFRPKWNSIDADINRKSYCGNYEIVDGRPLNPAGRTGIKGRGVLGKWGPNHAADPIVTRWKPANNEKAIHPQTKLPILQFCAIERHDCGEWAIPGGMIDPGEKVNQTLFREFAEEALNSLEMKSEESKEKLAVLHKFFENGEEIYRGYVDDHRNTDNAWMETVAVNFHDEFNAVLSNIEFAAGDDAKNVCWMNIDSNLNLYSSHKQFIQDVAKLRNAHW